MRERRRAARPATQPNGVHATVPSLDPFEPAELKTYKPPAPDESTVLAPKRKAEPRDRLFWLLAVLAVLGVIAVGVVWWTGRH